MRATHRCPTRCDRKGLCVKLLRSVHVIPVIAQANAPFGGPLWTDLGEARYPPPHTNTGESDADSSITGAQEPSPQHAQPVPVGEADNQKCQEDVFSEEEAADAAPPTQGHGRFSRRWSRLATAADNFAKGNAQTESTIIASC